MSFTTNRPTPTEKLRISQPLIQTNFNASNTWSNVDHYPFDDASANNGFHKTIHQTTYNIENPPPSNQITRSGPGAVFTNLPAVKTNIGEYFTGLYTPDTSPPSAGDTQLFAQTGLGGLSQLTGNNSQVNGYQWIGGVLLQWGFVAVTTTTNGEVDFQTTSAGIPFPNACFNVNATITYSGSLTSTKRNFVLILRTSSAVPTRTNFKWSTEIEDSVISGFFWVAIGN